MKFSEDYSGSENVITGYGSGFFDINHQRMEKSLLVFPDQETRIWDCSHIDTVAAENLNEIVEYQPELVIIGSGAEFAFPDMAVQAWLQTKGIGCEVMDSAAASRTYNVLLAEKRKVTAALLLI